MSEFFLLIGKNILKEIISISGIFFICGAALSWIEERVHTKYYSLFGWKGILFTAWFGTPMHEFGHIIMALLFRHRITVVSLFRPNSITGSLGHVEHSYNPKSLYQNIGNFFIGAAPMITGICLLVLFLLLFVPNGKHIVDTLTTPTPLSSVPSTILSVFQSLFSHEHVRSWSFWLFIYLSLCIVSHSAPSKQDRKNMWSGAWYIIGLLIIINIFFSITHIPPTIILIRSAEWIYAGCIFCIYALILSVIHYGVIALVSRLTHI